LKSALIHSPEFSRICR